MKLLSLAKLDTDSARVRYGVAVVSVILATLVRAMLTPLVDDKFPFATYFFAVLFSAAVGGYGPAAVSVALGGLASSFLFLPPRGFTIAHADDVIGLLLFIAVGAGIGALGGKMRAAAKTASNAAGAIAAERELSDVTLHSIGDAVIVTCGQGRVTALNPVAESLTGWTLREALGKPLQEVFVIENEDTGEVVENPVSKVLRHGGIVGLANHTILVAKDGTCRPIDDSAAPIRAKHGQILGVVLVFRDVSDRRQAERCLRDNEARKTAILDSALDCIITMDHEGKIVEFNPAAEQTFGYSRAESVGQQLAELIVPPRLRALHYQGLARYLATGEGPVLNQRIEIQAVRKDGSEFPVELAITQVALAGQPLFTAYLRDITDRKRQQDVIEEQARLANFGRDVGLAFTQANTLADTLQHCCEAMVLHLDGAFARIWTLNDSTNMLELEASAGLYTHKDGAHSRIPLGEFKIGAIAQERKPHLTNEVIGDPRVGEQQWAIEQGMVAFAGYPLLVEDHVAGVMAMFARHPIADAALAAMASVANSIAVGIERKRMQDVLESKNQALVEADRQKDEFMAMVAHELRNPLAPIRNALELMTPDADRETLEWVKSLMQRQVQHVVRLVDDLLDVSRVMRGKIQLKREPVELGTAIHHALEEARPLIDRQQQEFSLQLPEQPVWVLADPNRLSQVISNLLNNAAKYTEKQGKISLAVSSSDGHANISIRDTGIGIAPEMLDRIFEPFMQISNSLDRSGGGLGIGLALVRNLVEMHSGSVSAESDGLGKGSNFRVRLPAVDPPRRKEAARWKPSQVAKRRVLVVDDNQTAAQTLAMLMKKLWGHQVEVANDGVAALAVAEQFKPEVVLMDIGLPGLSGYEVAQRMREMPQADQILLVALTGYGQEEDRRRSFEAGFDEHLVKPTPVSVLQELFSHAKIQPPAN